MNDQSPNDRRRIAPMSEIRLHCPTLSPSTRANHTQAARRTSIRNGTIVSCSFDDTIRIRPTPVRQERPSRTSHSTFRVRQTASTPECWFGQDVKGRVFVPTDLPGEILCTPPVHWHASEPTRRLTQISTTDSRPRIQHVFRSPLRNHRREVLQRPLPTPRRKGASRTSCRHG